MKTTITLCLCFAGTAIQGFAIFQNLGAKIPAVSSPNVFIMPTDSSFPDSISTPGLASVLSNWVFGTPDVLEEVVTNGMTHALLDLGSFWKENPILIKSFSVIGRMVVLLHSLTHGHEVLPDELAFELGFLGLSVHSLYHAALPKIQAHRGSLLMTGKDRLAFRSLFRSAGFSWQQFREISLQSMAWVTVESGQVILDEAKDNAVFWLYGGSVQAQSDDGTMLHSISCCKGKDETS